MSDIDTFLFMVLLEIVMFGWSASDIGINFKGRGARL